MTGYADLALLRLKRFNGAADGTVIRDLRLLAENPVAGEIRTVFDRLVSRIGGPVGPDQVQVRIEKQNRCVDVVEDLLPFIFAFPQLLLVGFMFQIDFDDMRGGGDDIFFDIGETALLPDKIETDEAPQPALKTYPGEHNGLNSLIEKRFSYFAQSFGLIA